MKSDKVIATHIDSISYRFSLDGDISVYGSIFPPLQTEDNYQLDKISLNRIFEKAPDGSLCPSPGDYVSFVVTKDETGTRYTPTVKMNTDITTDKRLHLDMKKCPVCGSPLFESVLGYGRCISRSCRGQMSQTMILFCSGLGLSFSFTSKKIFEMLLVRGAFCSPVDLFRMTEDDVCFPGVSRLEAQSFLQYVHSVRGNTSVAQVLRGLRIPNMSDTDIDLIQAFFHLHNLPLDALLSLVDGEQNISINGERLPLDGLRVFCTIPENQTILSELCLVLK